MNQLPKKIHYCWFGRNPKPALVTKCIESWKKYMPDYEIIEWNEDNFDVNSIIFTKEAYEQKKWAYVSDYARFYVINRYGGIYFDTDVELLKPIPESVLEKVNFTGFEAAGKVNPGLVYADKKNGHITKEIIDKYQSMNYNYVPGSCLLTVNTVVTSILEPKGLKDNGKFQVVDGLTIFPSSMFCGYDQDVKEVRIEPDTISIHHYASSWTNNTIKKRVRCLLKKIIGVEGYRALLNIYRKTIKRKH